MFTKGRIPVANFSRRDNVMLNCWYSSEGQSPSLYVTLPNYMPIGQWAVAEILRCFFDFSSAILDLLYACLDHLWRVFGYLCLSAKFCWNPCSSFDN